MLTVSPHSSGKSTWLNINIGYHHNYLSTSSSECTKICVIIKYCKKNEVAKLYETQLVTMKKDIIILNMMKIVLLQKEKKELMIKLQN